MSILEIPNNQQQKTYLIELISHCINYILKYILTSSNILSMFVFSMLSCLAERGETAHSWASQLLKIGNNSPWSVAFIHLNNSETMLWNTTIWPICPRKQYFSALIILGPGTAQLEIACLRSAGLRACWNYSDSLTISLFTLPCLVFSMETTIKAVTLTFSSSWQILALLHEILFLPLGLLNLMMVRMNAFMIMHFHLISSKYISSSVWFS